MSAPTEIHSDNVHREDFPGEGALASDSGASFSMPLMPEGQKERSVNGHRRAHAERTTVTTGSTMQKRPGSELTDEELFKAYQCGSQQSFLVLYDKYKANIYAYCARTILSAGLDETLVEDAFQEVFLRLAQYQHTFTGGEFKAWLFTITRHTCLSTKKKGVKHRMQTERVGDTENYDEHTSSELRAALSILADDPLEALSKKEQTALLLKAIEMLPETYREALILSDYEGMTYDEIGKLTGTSLSTIRIRIFRAKARLRKMLLPVIGDEADRLIGFDPTEEE